MASYKYNQMFFVSLSPAHKYTILIRMKLREAICSPLHQLSSESEGKKQGNILISNMLHREHLGFH